MGKIDISYAVQTAREYNEGWREDEWNDTLICTRALLTANDRITELEAALRRIADPAGWSFVQVDSEASHTLNQQLAEMQRIAAEALRN